MSAALGNTIEYNCQVILPFIICIWLVSQLCRRMHPITNWFWRCTEKETEAAGGAGSRFALRTTTSVVAVGLVDTAAFYLRPPLIL